MGYFERTYAYTADICTLSVVIPYDSGLQIFPVIGIG